MTPSQQTELQERLDARTPKGWYGLAAPVGWYEIIDRLDQALVEIDPDYQVHQIKEKFGGLRFYCSIPASPGVQALMVAAEQEASRTCQRCGQPGVLRRKGSGWLATYCDEHGEGMEIIDE